LELTDKVPWDIIVVVDYYAIVKLFMVLKIPTNCIFKHNTSADSLEDLDGFLEKRMSNNDLLPHYQDLGTSLVDSRFYCVT